MAIRDKTTTKKWTYERSHKSLISYSLVEYNKIYPNTNSWKVLQEESLWQVDFDNLYFWNTLNKTHYGILVWNRNYRLLTIYKKHMYKDRWKNCNNNLKCIYINKYKVSITIWSQDLRYMNNVSKNRKKIKRYIKSSLHPSIYTPNKNLLY